MSVDNAQKIKLVKLLEILWTETDADHPLTTEELYGIMQELSFPANKKTVGRDLQTLADFGYPVSSRMVGHKKGYFFRSRAFTLPELKLLIDAVQATNFITPERSAELVEKLAALGGVHEARLLQGNLVSFNVTKHTNDQIYSTIEELETALLRQHKCSFYYFDLNENKERVYRHEKKRYIVEPVALVYNDDRYYLMAVSRDHDGITNYRLDRMEDVRAEKEKNGKKAQSYRSNLSFYTGQIFKMYGGESVDVTIEFGRKCLGSVYDKFGEGVQIRRTPRETFLIRVPVQVSPTFFSWVFQFSGLMKILSPDSVVQKYRDMLQNAESI